MKRREEIESEHFRLIPLAYENYLRQQQKKDKLDFPLFKQGQVILVRNLDDTFNVWTPVYFWAWYNGLDVGNGDRDKIYVAVHDFQGKEMVPVFNEYLPFNEETAYLTGTDENISDELRYRYLFE